MPKIKNIIIFLAVGVALVLVYIFFIKPAISNSNTPPLVSSAGVTPAVQNTAGGEAARTLTQDFLTLLLSVNNIKLDDAIFSDLAFKSLDDPKVTLTPDGSEGRINPFAPIGTDIIVVPAVPPANIGVPVTP